MKPVIAISMGDYNGIGPEVILKTLKQIDLNRSQPVITGHEAVFQYYDSLLGCNFDIRGVTSVSQISPHTNTLFVLNCADEAEVEINTGFLSPLAGKVSMKAVGKGADLCLNHEADALVTAPISKEAIYKAGYIFPGHTEFLADRTGTTAFQMILVNDTFRVALATIHERVRDIASLISPELLENQIRILNQSLKSDFGLENPIIAVLGLNPHAGDGGVIGDEEITIIRPLLDKMKDEQIQVSGPFAADGFFGSEKYKNFDAILAMYHDQGLIPFKTLSFGSGINFTAGLPIIRTSPDHGTGFDIAGMNKASSKSLKAAYELAVEMVMNKQKADA